MKVSDLIIGNFYRNTCQTGIKLVYVGLDKGHFSGQHDFDDVNDPVWGGSICNDNEVGLYIEPF